MQPLCFVPLAWVLGVTLGFGLMGIWSARVLYAALLAAVMARKFRVLDYVCLLPIALVMGRWFGLNGAVSHSRSPFLCPRLAGPRL